MVDRLLELPLLVEKSPQIVVGLRVIRLQAKRRGEMGDGPASVTLLGNLVQENRPVLYIEFRNSSDALDSDPWWIGGMKEARG